MTEPHGAVRNAGHPDVVRLAAARPSRTARVIAEVSDPAVVVAAVTVFVALISSPSWQAAAGWAALSVGFCAVLPYAALLLMLRSGRVADRHIVRREQRHLPALVALASVVIGLTLLLILAAPRVLVVLVISQLTGLASMAAVTRLTKASLHTAVGVGASCVVAWLLGGAWWALPPAAFAVIGWARWRGGRHTAAQIVLGGVIGAATTLGVFTLAG